MSEPHPPPTLVIVDTNVFMHFQPVSNIPWKRVVGEPVELVICAQVIRELDEQKDKGNSSAKKDRARSALGLVERAAEGAATLCDGVTLRVLPFEPGDDSFIGGLSATIPDDRILAAAVGLRASGEGRRVVVLSEDVGPRLKATALGLGAFRLPDDLRIKAEEDPRDAEVRRLTDRLKSLERALPQPVVRFPEGGTSTQVAAPDPELLGEVPDECGVALGRVRRLARPEERPPPAEGVMDDRAAGLVGKPIVELLRAIAATQDLMAPTPEQVDAYNREVDEYRRAYLDAHERWMAYRDEMAEVFVFRLVLENLGTAPAEHPDVYLRLSDKHASAFTLLGPDNLPPPPTMPTPPVVPSRATAGVDLAALARPPFGVPASGPERLRLDGAPETASWLVGPRIPTPRYVHYAEDCSYVRFGHQKLKHGYTLEYGPFALRRLSPAARGCGLTFEIHADNLPVPVTGTLNLRMHNS